MKPIYPILIASFLFCSCWRPERNRPTPETSDVRQCEKGRTEAREDIGNKVLGRFYFGLPTDKFQMYVRLLKEQYKIEVKGGGDLTDDFGRCYNEIMDQEIKKVYGQDFFTHVQSEIDSLYSAGVGDRQVSYPGGAKAMDQFFACNVRVSTASTQKQKCSLI